MKVLITTSFQCVHIISFLTKKKKNFN